MSSFNQYIHIFSLQIIRKDGLQLLQKIHRAKNKFQLAPHIHLFPTLTLDRYFAIALSLWVDNMQIAGNFPIHHLV